MQPNDFALVVAAARKEAERLLKSADRAAMKDFAPAFEIRGRNLWMLHGGTTADLGVVVAEKGDLGPRGVDGNNGRDGLDGKAGIDGRSGVDGKDGRDGIDGAAGSDGADGVGIATAYVSDAGYLIIVKTDGEKITAGYVKGKDGKQGTGGVMYGVGSATSGGGGATSWADITDKPTFAPVPTFGTVMLAFGAAPGTNVITEVVTGQAGIIAGSSARVWIAADSTADHNAYEHAVIMAGRVAVSAGDIVEGVGFTIYASTELRLTGNVACRWEWS